MGIIGKYNSKTKNWDHRYKSTIGRAIGGFVVQNFQKDMHTLKEKWEAMNDEMDAKIFAEKCEEYNMALQKIQTGLGEISINELEDLCKIFSRCLDIDDNARYYLDVTKYFIAVRKIEHDSAKAFKELCKLFDNDVTVKNLTKLNNNDFDYKEAINLAGYKTAIHLINEYNYEKAIYYLEKIGDYEDSFDLINECKRKMVPSM